LSETPNEPPSEVLFNKESLERFIELFIVKVENEKDKQMQMQNQVKAQQHLIVSLELKLDVLQKYHTFLKAKGFNSIERTVNAHMEDIMEAEKNRVTEIDEHQVCFKTYFFKQMPYKCTQPKDHPGACH